MGNNKFMAFLPKLSTEITEAGIHNRILPVSFYLTVYLYIRE